MSDGVRELQAALTTFLKADAGVAALVGQRVYDEIPAGAAKPYLSFGPIEAAPEPYEEEGSDITLQLDGWTEGRNTREAKLLGGAVKAALHNRQDEFTIAGNNLVALDIESTRYLIDPDGITVHTVLTLRARIEPKTS